MKKTIYLIGIAASIMGESPLYAGCEDYVTKSSENFPATTEDATQALAGIYQNLNQVSATPECLFPLCRYAGQRRLSRGRRSKRLAYAISGYVAELQARHDPTILERPLPRYNRANSLLDGIEISNWQNPTRTR